jgi:predicted metal-binding membrane protein
MRVRVPVSDAATPIAGSLVVLATLAWAWTAARADMPTCHGMALLPFLAMWTVMMVAMMLPSFIPVVLAFIGLSRSRGRAFLPVTLAFVAGYLVVWALLGLPARGLVDGTTRIVAKVPALAHGAGVVLVACGLYQLTPLKDACLVHCRVPQLFLGHHWRDGPDGAFLLGAHHGLYCAGCCASLMVVLLVVGMMNLAWMVGLSVLIALEKLLPAGRLIGRLAGLALVAVGVLRVIA